jgi:putative ATP-dependent endonuclease of OLD family
MLINTMNKKYNSGIRLTDVRIRNFRSLQNVDVQLDNITLIVGENNSGKSNFIDALSIAIGFGRPNYNMDDIFISKDEDDIDKERSIIIDVRFRPINENGEIIPKFPKNSNWNSPFAYAFILNPNDNDSESFGIRTTISWNSNEQKYELKRQFLKEWLEDSTKILESALGANVPFSKIEHLSLYAIDANRDIDADIKGKNIQWKRIISNLNLSEEKIEEFNRLFKQFNSDLTSSSKILGEIEKGFNDLSHFLNSEPDGLKIQGIPQGVEELSKKITLTFATKGSKSFPIEMHSSGTRSIASVLLLKIFFEYQRRLDNSQIYLPLIAIEEPESHLHPQAINSFFEYLKNIEGQLILTSHSPVIVKNSDIFSLRRFIKNDDTTEVIQLFNSKFDLNDINTINRRITKKYGDILFSNAMVLYEGEETEDQALPIFAREYWKENPANLGISWVSVNGHSYLPFVKFAIDFHIPFYIFSDGELDVKNKIEKDLNQIKEQKLDLQSEMLFIIPDGECFEEYISTEEYKEILVKVIINYHCKNEYHRDKLQKKWSLKSLDEISKELKIDKNKSYYGAEIAKAFCSMKENNLRIPELVRRLFDKIAEDLDLTVNTGDIDET